MPLYAKEPAILTALLHRKYEPGDERKEDLLTSAILGTAGYLPAEALWRPLLEGVVTEAGGALGFPVGDDVVPEPWPRWAHETGGATEPDLVLRWADSLVAIEVKYLSGKSSEADDDSDQVTDQLARQLVLARKHAAHERRPNWAVVYLTADVMRPRGPLQRSLAEVTRKTGVDLGAHLGWTSWLEVRAALERWDPEPPGLLRLRRDLIAWLDRRGFARFSGLGEAPTPCAPWRFGTTSDRPLRWIAPIPVATWTFTRGLR